MICQIKGCEEPCYGRPDANMGPFCVHHVCRDGSCTNPSMKGGWYCTKHTNAKRDPLPLKNNCLICGKDPFKSSGKIYKYCTKHACNQTYCENPNNGTTAYCSDKCAKIHGAVFVENESLPSLNGEELAL